MREMLGHRERYRDLRSLIFNRCDWGIRVKKNTFFWIFEVVVAVSVLALVELKTSSADVKPTQAQEKPSPKPVAEVGVDAQVPVEMPESDEASKKDREKLRRKGWRMLKPFQKVLAQKCQANPISCLCPPGTIRTVFHETPGNGQRARQLYMCQPTQCPEGRVLRKRTDVKTGIVRFVCEEVEE